MEEVTVAMVVRVTVVAGVLSLYPPPLVMLVGVCVISGSALMAILAVAVWARAEGWQCSRYS